MQPAQRLSSDSLLRRWWVLRIEEFSPRFLGIYRKVMEIEDEIIEYSRRHGVDPVLARAVSMYESGGNANLASSAGDYESDEVT